MAHAGENGRHPSAHVSNVRPSRSGSLAPPGPDLAGRYDSDEYANCDPEPEPGIASGSDQSRPPEVERYSAPSERSVRLVGCTKYSTDVLVGWLMMLPATMVRLGQGERQIDHHLHHSYPCSLSPVCRGRPVSARRSPLLCVHPSVRRHIAQAKGAGDAAEGLTVCRHRPAAIQSSCERFALRDAAVHIDRAGVSELRQLRLSAVLDGV